MNRQVTYSTLLTQNSELTTIYSQYHEGYNILINNDKGRQFFDNSSSIWNIYDYYNSIEPGGYSLKKIFSIYILLNKNIRYQLLRLSNTTNILKRVQFSTNHQKAKEVDDMIILPLIVSISENLSGLYLSILSSTRTNSIVIFSVFICIFIVIAYYMYFSVTKRISKSLDEGLYLLELLPSSVKNYVIENIVDIKKKEDEDD